MAQLSRHLLFPAEPNWPGRAPDDIYPREVRPSIVRVLWLALFGMLAFLATIIVLVWSICGV
jgi:hypothetical protein